MGNWLTGRRVNYKVITYRREALPPASATGWSGLSLAS